MSTNRVTVKKWKHALEDGKSFCKRIPDGEAEFMAWGCDYEDFEFGVGTYSTAIIRRDDGSIENVEASMVKFMEEAK